ncbi:MAG TPA: hypothetical protein VE133_14680, partial [Candidatus Sulfotelmatobacter sp.]|nr:hypothetical protein [Candidatus Sulfotelmatobacter sp.]
MRIYEILGAAVERVINAGVRALGKRVHLRNHPWLHSPAGSPGIVGAQMYSEIAGMENLEQRSSKTAGLLANFADLKSDAFDSARIHPRIRDFYERTAAYELEAWS